MSSSFIHPTAVCGEGCRIGHFSVINEGVVLGSRVTVGNGVTIYPGTIIGDDCIIYDNAVLGKPLSPAITSTVKSDKSTPPLKIGRGCTLGVAAVVYAGTDIGDYCLVGDLATIRERCCIGNYVIVGRGVAVENQVSVGNNTKIQTGAYITAYTTIEDYVFIGPLVKTYNDNFMGRTEERFKFIKGPTIRRGARVGGSAVLLPGVVVAEETFVAAGSLVARDTPPRKVVKGVPARVVRDVPAKELLDQ